MAFMEIKLYSNTMQASTSVNIILPTYRDPQFLYKAYGENSFPFYDDTRKRPVLYLLHGSHGDEAAFTRYSKLEYYADNYDILIVMPACNNSRFKDMPRCGAAYYTYLTVELPKIIKWMFPASEERDETFIGGFSMGAGGAFKVGMLNPDKYGYVFGLSGSYTFPDFYEDDPDHNIWSLAFEKGASYKNTIEDNYWVAEQCMKNPENTPQFYFSIGTDDFVYPKHSLFRKHLDRIGFCYSCYEGPGAHDWDFWDAELKKILEEWLPIRRNDQESNVDDKNRVSSEIQL